MIALIVALVAAATLIGGGGAVVAADGAAPGSLLYGLDQATENVRYDLTSNPTSKADLKLQFAEERLLEARDLAADGDDAGFDEAMAGYDQDFSAAISLLVSKGVDPDEALALLNEALAEQDETLDEIAENDNDQGEDENDNEVENTNSNANDNVIENENENENENDNVVENENSNTNTNSNDNSNINENSNTNTNTNDNSNVNQNTNSNTNDNVGDNGNTNTNDNTGEGSDWCVGANPHPVGTRLAEEFGVTYDTIMGYFCGGATNADGTLTEHHGFGGIRLAYRIAEKAGVDVTEVFALRDSGLGWGNVMKEYGLKGNGKNKGGDCDNTNTNDNTTCVTSQGGKDKPEKDSTKKGHKKGGKKGGKGHGNGGGNGNGNGNGKGGGKP